MFVGLHVHFTQVCTMFVAIISFVEIGQSSSKYIGIVENKHVLPPPPLISVEHYFFTKWGEKLCSRNTRCSIEH